MATNRTIEQVQGLLLVHVEVALLELDFDLSRPLLESTGWLGAHRRNQSMLEQHPVNLHTSSLAGKVPSGHCLPRRLYKWHSWSLMLFKNLGAGDEVYSDDEDT